MRLVSGPPRAVAAKVPRMLAPPFNVESFLQLQIAFAVRETVCHRMQVGTPPDARRQSTDLQNEQVPYLAMDWMPCLLKSVPGYLKNSKFRVN